MAPRSVLISGTSTGIGAACVARLAAEGWRVYAGVRKEADADRLTADVQGDVVPVILDVTNASHIASVLARVEDDVGQLEGLVNNAGVGQGGPIELLGDQDWQSTFDVNFFGLVALTREAFPLVRRGEGRFVHIGSIAGRVGGGGLGPYTSSKHAVEGFNWALREELRPSDMSSSVVEPGSIATAIWEKGDDTLDQLEARLDAVSAERYRHLVDATRGFIADGRQRGIDPDKVAQAVEHALTARRPRARYLVGADARIIGTVVTRFPDRAREAALALSTRLMARKGRKLR